MTGPAELLELAREAGQAAGSYLLSRCAFDRPAVTGTKTSPADIVTEMDKASELLIREHILSARPGDAFLGEEGGQTGAGRVRWIVDPLDGTVNYLYGRPDWTVSIAAEVDGIVIAGVVCVPHRGRTFTATAGGGAQAEDDWGNPRPVTCTAVTDLQETLVCTAIGYAPERRRVQAGVLAAIQPALRGIRCDGSAALDLCSVASGQADAYYESGLKPWDIAAGILIAREAGAVITGLHGAPPGPEMVLACGPGIAGPLHDLLAGAGAERAA